MNETERLLQEARERLNEAMNSLRGLKRRAGICADCDLKVVSGKTRCLKHLHARNKRLRKSA